MSSEFIVCRNKSHAALLEILKENEFKKISDMEEGYELLFTASSKEEALEIIREGLEGLSSYERKELSEVLLHLKG